MKIGMFTSGYQRNPLEHCFIDAKRFGYDYIELWGGRPHAFAFDLKAGDIREVRRLIDKYEMPVRGYTPEHNGYPYNFMIGSEAMRQDAVEYLKLSMDMAKEMGADFTLMSPAHAGYGATYEEIWTRLEKTMKELVAHAERIDHKIVLETLTHYESNAVRSANDLVELFRRVDSPCLVGMCDVVPPFVLFESIMDYFDKIGDKMYHMHIIDGISDSDSHVMPGEGKIPLPELFKELKDIDYQRTATIELVTGYINEPRMYARRAIDNVRAMMKDAGVLIMFIDMHVHPAFYEPINADPQIEELRHETLDIHKNGTAALEHIFNQMQSAGLDRLCLLPEDYNTQQNGTVLVSNQEIRNLVDLVPEKFIGFASVDPYDVKAPEKLEHAFSQLKLSGLKLHPGRQHFYPYDEIARPLYEICEKYNKPVIFHSGISWEPNTLTKYSRPDAFEELAAARPKLRMCLAHFGWPWCREVAMLMLKFPNVYTDTGALYFDSAQEFYLQMLTKDVPLTWIDRSLRHQVMFGSNNPRFEQIRMAQALEHMGFRDSTMELIRGQNAIDFLGGITEGGRKL